MESMYQYIEAIALPYNISLIKQKRISMQSTYQNKYGFGENFQESENSEESQDIIIIEPLDEQKQAINKTNALYLSTQNQANPNYSSIQRPGQSSIIDSRIQQTNQSFQSEHKPYFQQSQKPRHEQPISNTRGYDLNSIQQTQQQFTKQPLFKPNASPQQQPIIEVQPRVTSSIIYSINISHLNIFIIITIKQTNKQFQQPIYDTNQFKYFFIFTSYTLQIIQIIILLCNNKLLNNVNFNHQYKLTQILYKFIQRQIYLLKIKLINQLKIFNNSFSLNQIFIFKKQKAMLSLNKKEQKQQTIDTNNNLKITSRQTIHKQEIIIQEIIFDSSEEEIQKNEVQLKTSLKQPSVGELPNVSNLTNSDIPLGGKTGQNQYPPPNREPIASVLTGKDKQQLIANAKQQLQTLELLPSKLSSQNYSGQDICEIVVQKNGLIKLQQDLNNILSNDHNSIILVAIIGQNKSGKSTLLNEIAHTNSKSKFGNNGIYMLQQKFLCYFNKFF